MEEWLWGGEGESCLSRGHDGHAQHKVLSLCSVGS